MKILINILLVALTAFLVYLLYTSISEPIRFKGEKNKREQAVISKLENIRTCQELYRDITGEFAPSFTTLREVLSTDSIPFNQVLDDPNSDDPDVFIVNTIYTSAMDSLNSLGINLNDLDNVPFSNGIKFDMNADTMTYQKSLVWVTETKTTYDKFMGEFSDMRYTKYDDRYLPGGSIGFGSMNSPNLEGTWR